MRMRIQIGTLVTAVLVSVWVSDAVSYDGPTVSESPIADAAMRGDVASVQRLLEAGANVNEAQGDGMTALHWAARTTNTQLTELLVSEGSEVNAVTRIGAYTPLHLASQVGNAEIVRILLKAGSRRQPTSNSVGGTMPLHFAAASGSVDAVRALLDAGARPNVLEATWGQTPLMFGAAKGRTDVVRVLLEGGANPAIMTKITNIAARAEQAQEERRARNARMRKATAVSKDLPGQVVGDAGQIEPKEQPLTVEEQEEYDRPIEEPEPLSYGQLIGGHGGMTALLHAAREGHLETGMALLHGGADINQVSGSDRTSPMLIAMINGHFDMAMRLFGRGANPTIASDAGATPLYAAINAQWSPKSRYPQQHASQQQKVTYLEVMQRLLEDGVDPNVQLRKHLWWMSFNFDLLQVDTKGATPFWRAAYGLDVNAMRLLVSYGADPNIATEKVPPRRRPVWDQESKDLSGLPPIPVGGPADYPIHAASGIGYGQGFPSNAHRYVPDGWMAAVKYLIEELGADVNQRDDEGYAPLHNAASRGDFEMIRYLVEHGADVTAVSRVGQTTADMANGPYQRTQPFPEAVALLESLGSKNNHNCVSC
jgi:ankyrin repeat protein